MDKVLDRDEMREPHFLIVAENPRNREELGNLLAVSGGRVDQPDTQDLARQFFRKGFYDCVLIDRDIFPVWRDELDRAAHASPRETFPLIFTTGPENSLPHAAGISSLDGHLPRGAENARLLTEHVRQAINRIRESVVERKRRPAPETTFGPKTLRQEQFADSKIIMQTSRISAPGPSEDIVSVCDKGNDRYAILLGDCTGPCGVTDLSHLLLHSRLEMHLAESESPSQVLEDLNTEICSAGDSIDFVTAVAVFVDVKKRRLSYSIAGHHPPLHRRWGCRTWQLLQGHGIPLGIKAGEEYPSQNRSLGPGDKVLLISDGFLKIRGASGGLQDGVLALQEIDLLPRDAAPTEVMDSLKELVSRVAGSHTIADEITATLIQV
jgi:hypothetical protein